MVDCLKDPDISIRQRALELIYHLVNQENVETLTAELLNYLVLCPREHRSDICNRVLRVVDKFSPDDRWRVDTLITMLTIAGRECAPNVQSSTAVYISRSSEDLRAYSTHKLLKAVRDDDGSQRGLLNVGIWCIGEYGDLLLRPYSYNLPSGNGGEETVIDLSGLSPVESTSTLVSFEALEPTSVVSIVEDVVARHTCPLEVKQRGLTCFTKLSERFTNVADGAMLERLQALVKKYEDSHSLELQMRSCEYGALMNALKGVTVKRGSNNVGEEDIFGGGSSGSVSDSVSPTVVSAAKEALARMPVVDLKLMQRKREERSGAMTEGDVFNGGSNDAAMARAPKSSATSAEPNLLDLDDIFGGAAVSAPSSVAKQNGSSSAPSQPSDVDLLSDIFSALPAAAPSLAAVPSGGGFDIFAQPPGATPIDTNDLFAPQPATPTPAAPMNSSAAIIDLFGTTPAPTSIPAQQASSVQSAAEVLVPGFTHQGLTVEFKCTKPDTWNKQNSVLIAKFINTTDVPLYGLHLQVAVPKYVTMEMKPPTSTTIPVSVVGGSTVKEVTQTISVTNTMMGTKNLMLKVKASFTSKGTKVEHMTTCSGFPAGQF